MLEILEFYVSGFWIWLGISIGLTAVLTAITRIVVGTIAALRGTPVHLGDINNNKDH